MSCDHPRKVVRKFLARPQHEGAGAVVRRSIGRLVQCGRCSFFHGRIVWYLQSS